MPALADILSESAKEKVSRIILATFRVSSTKSTKEIKFETYHEANVKITRLLTFVSL